MTRLFDSVPINANRDLEWDGQGPNVQSLNGIIDNLQRQILLGGGGGGGGGGTSLRGLSFESLTTSTTDSDPGAGKFKWNNATQASATFLYFDNDTLDTITVSPFFAALGATGFIYLQQADDPANWQMWEWTSVPVAGVGYYKFPVSLNASAGAIDPASTVYVDFKPDDNSAGTLPSMVAVPIGSALSVNPTGPTAQWGRAWVTPVGLVGDDATNNSAVVTLIVAAINAGVNVAVLEPGTYRTTSQWGSITGNGILYSAGGVIWNQYGLANTKLRVFGGASEFHGGTFQNSLYKQYNVLSATALGDGFTLRLEIDSSRGAHDFTFGENLQIPYLVLASGTANAVYDITLIDADGIHIEVQQTPLVACTPGAVTYPVNPLDGSYLPYYPLAYRQRNSTANLDCLELRNCTAKFYGCTFRWSGAVGVLASEQWHDGVMEGCTITETGADGLHMVNCYDNHVRKNRILGVGDDCIALLSHTYLADRPRTRNVTVENNFLDQGRARGIAVVGGVDCIIAENTIKRCNAAGILLAAENEFFSPRRLTIRDNLIWTCGMNGALYGGWSTLGQPAVMFSPQSNTSPAKMIDHINFVGVNRIWNSRQSGFAGVITAQSQDCTVDVLDIDESSLGAWGSNAFRNWRVNRVDVARCGGHGFFVPQSAIGINVFEEMNFTDCNRGVRKWIKAVSVAGGILSVTLEDNVVNTFVGGNVVAVAGVKSDYNGAGGSGDAAVAVDTLINSFAPNGAPQHGSYTVATSVGQVITMVVAGLPLTNTAHAGVYDPSAPCPQAYLALISGAAAGNEAMNFDSSTANATRHIIKRAVLRSANYALQNFFEPALACAPRIAIIDPIDLSVGRKNMAQAPMSTTDFHGAWLSNCVTISDAAGLGFLDADSWLKCTGITRTGLAADTTDTMETALLIIDQLGLGINEQVTVPLINNTGFNWGIALSAGTTLAGGFNNIPPMTEVECQLRCTSASTITLNFLQKARGLAKLSDFPFPFVDATDANVTINSERLFGQVYWRTVLSAPRNLQLPTVANLILSLNAKPGMSFNFQVWNTGANTNTLTTGGAGWTLVGLMTTLTGSKSTFNVLFTSVSAATITRVTLTDT